MGGSATDCLLGVTLLVVLLIMVLLMLLGSFLVRDVGFYFIWESKPFLGDIDLDMFFLELTCVVFRDYTFDLLFFFLSFASLRI